MESTIKIKQEPGLSPKSSVVTTTSTQPLSQPATATVKTERLTSFRVPRDLTLGGLTNGRAAKPAANKKVYTPNLNAVRNKDTNVKTASTGPKQRAKPERNKDGKAGGGAGRGKSALIQTSGIFSEGLAQRQLQRSRYEKMNNSSGREPGEAMRRPMLRSEIKVDPEEERKRISDLFGEGEDDELMAAVTADGTKKLEANMPVKLDNLDYKIKLSALKAEVKDELPKQEASDLLDAIKANGIQNNLFLLQLPDALPGKTDTEVTRKPDATGQPEGNGQENGTQQDPPRCTVRELEEGYIGKVLRYRSGKVKLLLGETMFDLTMGMDSGFLQELVSINTNASERSGNIIDLATIKAKLNASPDWEYLFKKAA